MGERKKVIKIFLPWQDENELSWLEDMASSGWQLEKKDSLGYHFTASTPARKIYRSDYQFLESSALEDYLHLFTESGWEHAASYGGFHYFRISSGVYNIDIFSDNATRIERLRKMLFLPLTTLTPIMMLMFFTAWLDRSQSLTLVIFLVSLAFFLILLGLYIVWILRIIARINTLKKEDELT